jgi:polyribonucleotide 5'-hydroxyl-kinase
MAGGYVIDTTALDKVGALEVQTAFGADVIAVIDDEKLYNSLVSTVPKGVTVIKLAKSGGVMPRDADIRRRERLEQVKRYFYGPVMAGVSMLHCYTFQVCVCCAANP